MEILQKEFQDIVHKFKVYQGISTDWTDQNTLLFKAFEFGESAHRGQTRDSGEPFFSHPLAVAKILVDYQCDLETLIAGLLHDTIEDCADVSKQLVEKEFGKTVSDLIDGVTKIQRAVIRDEDKVSGHQETLRKIFLYARKDPRVILIKLADRIHNMWTLNGKQDARKRKKKALETIEIYMPVAAELGIWKMKKALENAATPHLHPREFLEISQFLEKEKAQRDEIIALFSEQLRALDLDQLTQEILIHERGYYTLHKVRKERVPPHLGLHDILMTKCIVENRDHCYKLLARLHSHWQGRHGDLKDYISCPKSNGYQGLHTTIITQSGLPIHVRILTREMHDQDSFGITRDLFQKRFKECSFLAPLIAIDQATKNNSGKFVHGLKQDILQEKITVHSRYKSNILVPKNATVLDFAFLAMHEKAVFVRSVLINDRQQDLSTVLQDGDLVEIEVSEREQMNFQWFYCIHTQQARIILQSLLKKQDYEQKVLLGRKILQEYFEHRQQGSLECYLYKKCFREYMMQHNLSYFEQLYVLIAEGILEVEELYNYIMSSKTNWLPDLVQKFFSKRWSKFSTIGMQLDGIGDQKTLLNRIIEIGERTGVKVQKYVMRSGPKQKFRARLICRYQSGAKLPHALTMFMKLAQVSSVSIFLTWQRKIQLALMVSSILAFWFGAFYTLSAINAENSAYSKSLLSFFSYIGLAVILLSNYFLYSFVKNYLTQLRSNLILIVLGSLSNIFAITVFVQTLLKASVDWFTFGLLCPIFLFLAYVLFVTIDFVKSLTVYSWHRSKSLVA